jgi:hypothetical protein
MSEFTEENLNKHNQATGDDVPSIEDDNESTTSSNFIVTKDMMMGILRNAVMNVGNRDMKKAFNIVQHMHNVGNQIDDVEDESEEEDDESEESEGEDESEEEDEDDESEDDEDIAEHFQNFIESNNIDEKFHAIMKQIITLYRDCQKENPLNKYRIDYTSSRDNFSTSKLTNYVLNNGNETDDGSFLSIWNQIVKHVLNLQTDEDFAKSEKTIALFSKQLNESHQCGYYPFPTMFSLAFRNEMVKK